MDSKERVAAANALISWFNSQEIPMSEAKIIMTKVIVGGEGSIEQPRPFHDDPYFCISTDCERCGGSGWECE